MIERQIVASNVKEQEIQEYIMSVLKNLGHSHIKLQRTPLGEKIIIHASRPGLIVGRKGQNIRKLTEDLKSKFKLENPQIEINEVEQPNLDAQIVAERIASSLEKFGTQRFKGIGHKVLTDVMDSGALGVEILITGKIPSSRAKRWRFYQGYLKKCGDVALEGVRHAYAVAHIKTGAVGIQVSIMPSETQLPDTVEFLDEIKEVIEEISDKKDNKKDNRKNDKKNSKKDTKKKPAKKPAKKSTKKTEKVDNKEEKSESKPSEKKEEKTEPKETKTEDKKEQKTESKKVEEKKEKAETKKEEKKSDESTEGEKQ